MAVKLMQVDLALTALRVQELERQLAKEREALAEAQPVEPAGENRVIRFAKYGNTYCFAAIKVRDIVTGVDRWYVTQDGSRSSRQGHAPKTWDALLEWIGERNWGGIEVLS